MLKDKDTSTNGKLGMGCDEDLNTTEKEDLKADVVHMNCAAHVVDFLRTNMSTSAAGVYSLQVRECQGIPELRSLHVVRGYSRTDGHCIAVRELTCFCFIVCM